MKWKATHILKVDGDAPRRVMLNSGELYTRQQWDYAEAARWYLDDFGNVLTVSATKRHDLRFSETASSKKASIKPIAEMKRGESTTSMRKAVSRITSDFKVKIAGKWRRLIVTMGPGDLLTMRPEGCRSSSARTFDYGSAWGLAGKQQARKLVRERKEARKAKRAAA